MPNNEFNHRVNEYVRLMQDYVTSDMTDWLADRGFFDAPASTKFHGAHEGGLYEHSAAVTQFLVNLTRDNHLTWKNPRSPYIVGMFHDLCKIDSYKVDNSVPYTVGEPTRWQYNTETLLKGHGDKSVMLLSQFYELTEEEILCIRYHMGAFVEKEEWRDYTRAVNLYPNVLWTHTADMLAAHVSGT
jgi:hypothetical protein